MVHRLAERKVQTQIGFQIVHSGNKPFEIPHVQRVSEELSK